MFSLLNSYCSIQTGYFHMNSLIVFEILQATIAQITVLNKGSLSHIGIITSDLLQMQCFYLCFIPFEGSSTTVIHRVFPTIQL